MTPPVSPGKKAIDYAELTLGVNAVYKTASAELEDLKVLTADLHSSRESRRKMEALKEDRETALAIEARGANSEMSEAAMSRHLKSVYFLDDALKSLRTHLGNLETKIWGLEYDVKMTEQTIRVQTARMEELGGYLQYLAVIKTQASSS